MIFSKPFKRQFSNAIYFSTVYILITNFFPALHLRNDLSIEYAWDNPLPNGDEPKLWFHEVFKKDGSPYKQDEVNVIKKLNGKQ